MEDIEAVDSTVSTSVAYLHRNRDAADEIRGSFTAILEAVEANGETMRAVDQDLEALRGRLTTMGQSSSEFREGLETLRAGLEQVVSANREIAAAMGAVTSGTHTLTEAAESQDQMLRGFEI
jgi:methyl-accepting chemotaxis protein